jgi:uncharacterized pyridoxamine 5'-phosphate oxidase family protein
VKEVLSYLKECGTFYLATVEGDQPRVRPFGVVAEFEGKLYIATNNEKSVYRQMLANPRVEISATNHGTWLRLEAKAHHDDRKAARERMLEENPSLNRMYSADDGRFAVLCLEDATASIFGGGEGPRVVKF